MHDPIGASIASAPATTAARSHGPLLILYLLDAFVVGGVVALWAVHRLLVTIMHRLVPVEAGEEILNVLDHLLPYEVGYGAAFLALALLTLGAWLWQARRR